MELSGRCYQVKPPTTGCRHSNTMVTTRCGDRVKEDLLLPLRVSSLIDVFISFSVSQVLLVLKAVVFTTGKVTCISKTHEQLLEQFIDYRRSFVDQLIDKSTKYYSSR